MKTKNEIYVVVDTPKKAKKLQKVLDMFGEKTYKELQLELNVAIHFWNNNSWAFCIDDYYPEGKQKVSIKELRNILAVEHLKEGDFVVCGIGHIEYVTKYKRFDGNHFESIDYNMIGGSGKNHGSGCFDNFIRYATEEERSLLEPKEEKKELEVGKWYKANNALFNHQNGFNSYGFSRGSWTYCNWRTKREDWINDVVLATAEEVKQALIKEAEKLYNVGDKVKSLTERAHELIISEMKFNQIGSINDLWVTCENGTRNCLIFRNGKWAEVLPQPDTQQQITYQDIATLERLHDTLSDVHGYSLEFELMKSARVLADKLRELNTQNK